MLQPIYYSQRLSNRKAGFLGLEKKAAWSRVYKLVTFASSKKDKDTLSSLDALLGSTDEGPKPEDGELMEWWRIRPQQSAPPRTKSMSPGSSGRFVMSEEFMETLRVGRKTELGSQLEVPKVQPVLSFVLFLVNFSCAGTYMNVQAFQGPDIGREYLLGICNSSLKLADGGLLGLLHPLLSCFQAPGPLELCVVLWALAAVGPRVEAAVGSLTFLSVYLLSGYSGALTTLALQQAALFAGLPFVSAADASCGASPSLVGVAACLAVYQFRNAHLDSPQGVAQAEEGGGAQQRLQSSSSGGSSSAANGGTEVASSSANEDAAGAQQQQRWQQQLLFANAVGVVVASLALAVVHREGPYEGVVPVSLLPILIGGITGGTLADAMGPRYYVQQEVQIPEGAMYIPENTREMAMLLDRTTGLKRGVVALGSSALLLVVAQCLSWLQGLH